MAKPKNNIEFTVEEPAQLLDFLLSKLTGKSRNNVKSILSGKAVSVDGKTRTHFDHPLSPGQTVAIAPPGGPAIAKKKQLKIIFEDKDLIAIDKPAGLLSIANETEKEKTAYHLMTDYVRLADPNARIFVVHRLDRDTSGVLIAAKNEELKHALQDNWNELVQTRCYLTVVEGHLDEKRGRVKSWIYETKTHLMYSGAANAGGQEAITDYEVLKESREYSLLQIKLATGRKNQIRVHMKDLGHPVAGDKTYGAATDPIKRLALHANLLEIKDPYSDTLMTFESKAPQNFLSLFQA